VDVAGNAQLLSHFLDNPWQAAWLNNPERRYGNPFPPVTARERLPASGPRN
jgi:hypothetical protein